jgi:low affinity Fe/Cu permease
MKRLVARAALLLTAAASSPWALGVAVGSVLAWLAGGWVWGFGTDYQLVANTATTLTTYVLGFAILSAQARDTKALQLQIAELLRAIGPADNRLINASQFSDEQVIALLDRYAALGQAAGDGPPGAEA